MHVDPLELCNFSNVSPTRKEACTSCCWLPSASGFSPSKNGNLCWCLSDVVNQLRLDRENNGKPNIQFMLKFLYGYILFHRQTAGKMLFNCFEVIQTVMFCL